jgi:CheY-like chemotaxis protein
MRTILVVEDYDDVRQILRVLLESENYRVLEAASGPEALEVLQDERPDLILMDVSLPGFDGMEAIRRIRLLDGFRNTPIIVLTAYTGRSTYETALSVGGNYFRAKPIDFDELVALLKEIFYNGSMRNSKRAASPRTELRSKPVLRLPRRELTYSV